MSEKSRETLRPGEIGPDNAASPDSHYTASETAVSRSLRRELFWLVPIGITVVGATLFMLLNRRWGSDASAILSSPVGLVGIVVAILIERGVFKGSVLRVPRGRRRTWRWMAVVIAVILAATSVMWWVKREGDPFDYLAGHVRIGYTSTYEGWHTNESGIDVGFDVDIARAIEEHFSLSEIEWVPLGDLKNRFAALRGEWRDSSGRMQSPVKLVISNFSATAARAELVDFAGPYFVDVQGFLGPADIDRIDKIPREPGKVCVLEGSTTEETFKRFGWQPDKQPTVAACVAEYRSGKVDAVSADLSTLAGFALSIPDQPPPISLKIGAEKYAVAMPDKMPRLCAEISYVLDQFVRYRWDNSFRTNFDHIKMSQADYHRPLIDPCQQPAPWYD